MRDIDQGVGWDVKLSSSKIVKWNAWLKSLQMLKDLAVPRMFLPSSFSVVKSKELLVFCDASEKAVSAVAYVKDSSDYSIGFVMGNCKLAPLHGHTIPRLELCAALLGAEMADTIIQALDNPFSAVRYFSDSKVVLGYLYNTTKRFYNYVSNRVHRIHSLTTATQWCYVDGKSNPADIGSRGCSSLNMLEKWLEEPKQLESTKTQYPVLLPDPEVRNEVVVLKVSIETELSSKFVKFSSWGRLVSALVVFKRAIRRFKAKKSNGEVLDLKENNVKEDTKVFVLEIDQRESFRDEIDCLSSGHEIPKKSSLKSLSPFMDSKGLLRVGGRVGLAGFPQQFSQPVILSGKSHIARLIASSFHENECQQQGRLFTESAIRSNGFWIIGAKLLVSR